MAGTSNANTLLNRLRDRAREFRAANAANVTVTFALATIPMAGFVGAAVDYSHANAVKAAMQAAADSTALMLSKNASTLATTDLQTKANDYFKALYTRSDSTGLLVSATYSTASGSQIIVNASSNVKTNFMGLMGFSSLRVAVDSQVKWGNSKLRVALALDNTGSMAMDGKMDALKAATKNLLTQLKGAAAKDGDVYVSIIPFSKDVNVGKGSYAANWIDWTQWNDDNGDDVSTVTCTKNGKKTKCTTSTSWVPNNHNTWNGCVTDRGKDTTPTVYNTDQNVTGVDITKSWTMFPAEQYDYCPAQMSPLSYDWTAMNTLVTGMFPNGNTNQNIGLAHAWMSLVGGGPYPAPPYEDPNYKYSKIIILLTDGLNTENRWYTNPNQIDNRQATTCDNIKAAGITIYTVQVNTTADPTQAVLKNCASSADKFFLLTSSTQLVAAFQQIGTNLSNLRISQ